MAHPRLVLRTLRHDRRPHRHGRSRAPVDYSHRVWSTAFRAADLADAGSDEESEYSDTSPAEDTDPEQDDA